jgi:protein gp37
MGTKIEWADETWNPVIGCSKISEGCVHCYAIGTVHRGLVIQHRGVTTHTPDAGTDWTGAINLAPEAKLLEPLRKTKPVRYFVNSLSDLFHPNLPAEEIARVFAVMALAQQHTFQVLTKRPQRMAELLCEASFRTLVALKIEARIGDAAYEVENAIAWPLPNVWLGTSIELDKYSWRANHLRATPAAVRFISAEPLLGPLPSLDLTDIDWLIVGGESGPGARPMHPDWVRELRDRATGDQCREHPCAGRCIGCAADSESACTPPCRCDEGQDCSASTAAMALWTRFFFKQWGAWLPFELDAQAPFWNGQHPDHQLVDGHSFPVEIEGHPAWSVDFTGSEPMVWRRLPKAETGRELDGRTWDEFPVGRS